MTSHLHDASTSLDQAVRAITTGGLQCLRATVEADLQRFGGVLDALRGCESSTMADADSALRAITSYLLLVSVLADKSTVMQALLHQQLHEASERAHAAVDDLGRSTKKLGIKPREPSMDLQRRLELVQQVANASNIGDPAVQEEAMAYIAYQERHASSSSHDPLLVSIKERLLAVTSHEITDRTSRVLAWYITEQELEFVRPGHGSAIEAIHVPTGRLVEVQRVQDASGDPFATTATLWWRLKDENVIRLVGASHLARPWSLQVTELCANGSLDSFLRANESTRSHLAISLLLQAARGVSEMHSAGVVHGDLRCANVGVTADQQAKVTGLTHCIDGNAQRFRQYSSVAGGSVSSVDSVSSRQIRWLAPECVSGDSILSTASDVYAFGMMLYEALTGVVPFAELNDEQISEMKKRGDVRLPERGLDQIDREARNVIQDACHANAILRPSMQIVMMSLRSLARSSAATAATVQANYARMTHTIQPSINVPAHAAAATDHVHVSSLHSTAAPHAHATGVAVPTTTMTGKGPITVYPVATPAGYNPSPHQLHQQPSEPNQAQAQLQQLQSPAMNPLVTGVWQPPPQVQSTQQGKVLPTTERPQPSLSTPPVHTPPPLDQKATPTWKKLLRLGLVIAVMVIVGTVVPSIVKKSTGSSSSVSPTSGPSPAPTPSSTVRGGSGSATPRPSVTPTPAPTQMTGAVSTFQQIFGPTPICAIAVSNTGEVYVGSYAEIYRFTEAQANMLGPSPIAGGYQIGYVDGASSSSLLEPYFGLAVDSTGALFIADGDNYVVRRIDSGSSVIATVLGLHSNRAITDGAEASARFYSPSQISVGINNDMYIGDGSLVRRWDRSGQVVSTVRAIGYFNAITVSPTGALYFADDYYIGMVGAFGALITVAGSTSVGGYADGISTAARFQQIKSIAFSPSGEDLYIADSANHCIRRYNVAFQQVTTLAGLCGPANSGNVDAVGTNARFSNPVAIAVGPSGTIYVGDNTNTVRRIK